MTDSVAGVAGDLVDVVAEALFAGMRGRKMPVRFEAGEVDRDIARIALATVFAKLAESEEAIAVLAPHFGTEAWMADPPNDARDALRDLARHFAAPD